VCAMACGSTWATAVLRVPRGINTRVFSYVFDAAGAQGSGYYKAAKPSGQSLAKPPPPPPPRIESTHGGAAVIFEEEDLPPPPPPPPPPPRIASTHGGAAVIFEEEDEDEAGQATVSLEPSPSVGSVDPVRPHILRNACERGSLVRLRRMFAVATFRP
jgi:hypothetical protein